MISHDEMGFLVGKERLGRKRVWGARSIFDAKP